MKIVEIEAIPMRAPMGEMSTYWDGDMWSRNQSRPEWTRPANEWRFRPVYASDIETTLVRIATDEGLEGWGECHAPYAPAVCATIIEQLLAPLLIGADPMAHGRLWERMYGSMRLRSHSAGYQLEAVAGIDIALWDLKGKILGAPVHALLGGPMTERLPAYHSHLPAAPPELLGELARRHVAAGYTAIKVCGGSGVRADVEMVEAIREAVGADVRIMVDAGGVYDLSTAATAGREFDRLGVWYFEDPMPHEAVSDYGRLAGKLDLAVAGGEALCNRFQFREYFAVGGLEVALPDVSRSGGITETFRIAELADIHHALYNPHISVGSAIYIAASLHLAASAPNLGMVEHWTGTNPIGEPLIEETFGFADGSLRVPSGPGLGVTVRPEVVDAYRLSARGAR